MLNKSPLIRVRKYWCFNGYWLHLRSLGGDCSLKKVRQRFITLHNSSQASQLLATLHANALSANQAIRSSPTPSLGVLRRSPVINCPESESGAAPHFALFAAKPQSNGLHPSSARSLIWNCTIPNRNSHFYCLPRPRLTRVSPSSHTIRRLLSLFAQLIIYNTPFVHRPNVYIVGWPFILTIQASLSRPLLAQPKVAACLVFTPFVLGQPI